MNTPLVINLSYIVASALFIFGLKMMSSPATARNGNLVSAVGMFIATVVTLLDQGILTYQWIGLGILAGTVVGVLGARMVAMTAMPEMVALFNGTGGAASLLVGWAALYPLPALLPEAVAGLPGAAQALELATAAGIVQPVALSTFTVFTIYLSILIGGVTVTGSFIAYAKLAELMPSAAIVFGAQRIVNALLLAVLLGAGVLFCMEPVVGSMTFWLIVGLSLLLGVMVVIPIGGADMPVVISLLNSYSGLAACAAGFAINNNVLIVAGSLVGASGIILTQIMCKAMNRSLANVLFSGFGAVKTATKLEGEVRPITGDDAYLILEAATNVVVVPGYGMAVSQAQHVVRELSDLLQKNGCEVSFAIHPVAGRMPGHMNVLLAEANVPYEQLVEMDDINPRMDSVDVCIVIGANDVVNPAAGDDPNSPIYGMPIIETHRARTVFVLKRSMASGFSGVDNSLFFKENTRMLFGDAKASIQSLVAQFKG